VRALAAELARSFPLLLGEGSAAARLAGWAAVVATALALAAAVVTDLRSRRILNAITLPSLFVVLLCQLIAGGPPALLRALLGLLVCAGPFFLASLAGFIGMGDVKLLAVVGAFLGPNAGAAAVFWVAIAGGAQAMLALAAARLRGAVGPHHVPYACAIGAGSLLAILLGLPG
jgi:prepilin peptidase CpaA